MTIAAKGIKGKSWGQSLAALVRLPLSFLQSVRILRSFKPDVVIGVGGYASGPLVMTACLLRIRTAIAEQNAIPGATNRLLGRFVDRVFLAFPPAVAWFSLTKTQVTGNPVRRAFSFPSNLEPDPQRPLSLLVFGGSQGSRAINQAMVEALKYLQDLRNSLRIVHQTGTEACDRTLNEYAAQAIEATVVPFIADMADAFRHADLLICRAGATSIAEITTGGRASILIPYPFAIRDHQTKNAEVLVKAGAAVMIPEERLSGEGLARQVRFFHDRRDCLGQMAAKSKAMGHGGAAGEVVRACRRLAGNLKSEG
jgi:UDP-N-acetylglucosamine--N-acetylmuramyl-(pentapeptide) pyrophosphoryl-undecaprenol N-acetylglucosamine transferase